MAGARKVLGQVALSATTLTPIYTVPAATQSVVSTFYVCNRAATFATFRLSVATLGAADDPKQYVYYEVSIPPNETFAATAGMTVDATDEIRGYASDANLTMTLFGMEIT